jgi:hypothetical protein
LIGLIVPRALAFALAVAPPIHAQAGATCPPVAGDVFLRCQVDVPPRPLPGRRLPLYPTVLLQSETSGIVRATWVVDTGGRARPATFTVLDASHELLAQSLRNTVPGWRFSAAMRGGRRVAARYEEVFQFEAMGATVHPPPVPLLRSDSTADGTPLTVIGWVERDPSGAAALGESDVRAAQRASFLEATKSRRPAGGPDVVVCVGTMRDGERVSADAGLIRGLAGPGLRSVGVHDCPRTYQTMFVHVDSLGRRVDPPPPGWVDPHHLSLLRTAPVSGEYVLVDMEIWVGTSGSRQRCLARRNGGTWTAVCLVTARMSS